jgi:hypothetical protein
MDVGCRCDYVLAVIMDADQACRRGIPSRTKKAMGVKISTHGQWTYERSTIFITSSRLCMNMS